MKVGLLLILICMSMSMYAVIPGFGLNYGSNSLYAYGEYNCSVHNKEDQFFMSYLEYGLTDWQSLIVQNISYPDGSYEDLSIGAMQQIYKHDYFNIRAGASYIFGPKQKGFAEGMYYSAYANGLIYGNFGYICQLGVTHIFGEKPNWANSVYLTYNIIEELAVYVSVTSDMVHFEDSIDFSIGGWYALLQYKCGLEWVTLYFDVANVVEHKDGVRLSIGIDILY